MTFLDFPFNSNRYYFKLYNAVPLAGILKVIHIICILSFAITYYFALLAKSF